MRPNAADDDALLVAAAAGDKDAFAAFYERWLPVVVGFHLRRTGSRELAFDLTAETFAAVVSACGEFRPDRGPAPVWLFSIARNKLRDSIRRSRVEASARRKLGLEPVIIEDADLVRVEELASLGNEDLLGELLAELPEQQRSAIFARVLQERDYEEIATELGCSKAVVRQRVHRGLSRLRERLQETS